MRAEGAGRSGRPPQKPVVEKGNFMTSTPTTQFAVQRFTFAPGLVQGGRLSEAFALQRAGLWILAFPGQLRRH
jgi:hypothetical protein